MPSSWTCIPFVQHAALLSPEPDESRFRTNVNVVVRTVDGRLDDVADEELDAARRVLTDLEVRSDVLSELNGVPARRIAAVCRQGVFELVFHQLVAVAGGRACTISGAATVEESALLESVLEGVVTSFSFQDPVRGGN